MHAQTWISLGLAIIAVVALYFTGLSAWSAHVQTKHQEQSRRDQAQPYVWADLRPDKASGQLLELVVGNAGPSVATNVRVDFQPPPPNHHDRDSDVTVRLREQGIASLAPGRTMAWSLGAAAAHVGEPPAPRYTVAVSAEGPFGGLPALIYDIDMEDLRYTRVNGDGSLRRLTEAITQLAKQVSGGA